MKKHKFKTSAHSGALIFGLLISVISLSLSALVLSFILSKLEDPVAYIGIASLFILILSAAISGFATSKKKGEGGTLCALLSALIVSALIFAVSLIASGGKVKLSFLMNILCYLLVSATFGKLASFKKKRRRH